MSNFIFELTRYLNSYIQIRIKQIISPLLGISIFEFVKQANFSHIPPFACARSHQRARAGLSPGSLIGYTAGLLYFGTGLMTTAQMIMAAMGATGTNMIPLTLIFAIIPIILGLLILRKALKTTGEWSIRDRVVTMLLAVFGLVFWAGLVIGPILTMIFSLVSPYNSKK